MSCHYPDLGGASTLNGKQTPLKQVKRNFKIVYNSFSTNYEIIYDLQPAPAPRGGGGGCTPSYRDVPLDRVWFSSSLS